MSGRGGSSEAMLQSHKTNFFILVSDIAKGSCLAIILVGLSLIVLLFAFVLYPASTNFLVLGIDRTPQGTYLGRSDTIILVTANPLKPYVGMLSIPRDLWVNIPGVGENRINTAHFFAELNQPNSGPYATMQTIEQNFGVRVHYFVRLKFDSLTKIVDALGGVDITLEKPMAGYSPGNYHLNGEQSLAFVRDRQGSDDFFRMQRGQMFVKAIVSEFAKPPNWSHLPFIFKVMLESADTNLPPWEFPRVGVALLRVGIQGIDGRMISREMVKPFTANGGAQVLAPDWSKITPLIDEMFSR